MADSLDFLSEDISDADLEMPVPPKKMHTWSAASPYDHSVKAYCIQTLLHRMASDALPVIVRVRKEFEFAPGQSYSLLADGDIIFNIEDNIYFYSVDYRTRSQSLSANRPIDALLEKISNVIRHENPLINKHIQMVRGSRGLTGILKEPPQSRFECLILPPEVKEDIYDNTILHLQKGEGHNGIIFHGPPGTGKSHACQAIIAEALHHGFSSCYLVGDTSFTSLEGMVESYLTPCLIVLEDIDTFVEDRKDGRHTYFADFLQFMSGLNERRGKFVVIATTNYLEFLDEAVRNRPVRFNRKYEFGYPSDEVLDQLLEFYFGKGNLSSAVRALCYGRQFSGAHINEIKRTASVLARRTKCPPHEMFEEALEIVGEHFQMSARSMGFVKGD